MEAKFKVVWGAGYVAKGPVERTIDYFTTGEGWDAADIDAIENLGVGESYTFDFAGDSTVTRIE